MTIIPILVNVALSLTLDALGLGSRPTSECLLPFPRRLQGPCGPPAERNQPKRVATKWGFNLEVLIFRRCLGERLTSKYTQIDFHLPEPQSIPTYCLRILLSLPISGGHSLSWFRGHAVANECWDQSGGMLRLMVVGYHFQLDADCDVP